MRKYVVSKYIGYAVCSPCLQLPNHLSNQKSSFKDRRKKKEKPTLPFIRFIDATSINFHTFIIYCYVPVLMEMTQMPHWMLNRNCLIKKCFEAYMNFKGICNQSIFLTSAGMECAKVCLCEDTHAWKIVYVHVCWCLH